MWVWCLFINEWFFLLYLLLLHADRKDLVYIRRYLKTLLKWKDLGLSLGLTRPQVMRIEKEQRGDIDYCIMEMLVIWLGILPPASWSTLKTALKKIGEYELADTIPTDGELEWSSGWLYIVDPLPAS